MPYISGFCMSIRHRERVGGNSEQQMFESTHFLVSYCIAWLEKSSIMNINTSCQKCQRALHKRFLHISTIIAFWGELDVGSAKQQMCQRTYLSSKTSICVKK